MDFIAPFSEYGSLVALVGENAAWTFRGLDRNSVGADGRTSVRKVVLLFEDLQWLDSETEAFLDVLVERLAGARILLLLNYRPEYQHGWRNKTYYTQIRLDPLPPASAEALLQSLLGEDASLEPLKQRLIERTQGNPFFLEESIRTLVETQVLVGERGAYRLAPQVGAAPRGRPRMGNHRGVPLPIDIQIPATVQAVLAARIDRLPPEEKQLLQTAVQDLRCPVIRCHVQAPARTFQWQRPDWFPLQPDRLQPNVGHVTPQSP